MVSRILEIVVILALRINFLMLNKRRDKMFAEGHDEYDPEVEAVEDIGDMKNPRFRYIGQYTLHSFCMVEPSR